MIRLKTSRLFAGSMRIGASLKGVDAGLIDQLDNIGEKLGLGFQIQDDYLGIWGGKTGKTGKSVSTDLTTRKKAYPALIGLEKKALNLQKSGINLEIFLKMTWSK